MKFPALKCFGILCRQGIDHDYIVPAFHITCLWCRMRRRVLRGYIDPPYMILYLYDAFWKPPNFRGVNVDPRGNFTHLRLSTIIMLDKFMLRLHVGKPLIEVCEFLANYPVW